MTPQEKKNQWLGIVAQYETMIVCETRDALLGYGDHHLSHMEDCRSHVVVAIGEAIASGMLLRFDPDVASFSPYLKGLVRRQCGSYLRTESRTIDRNPLPEAVVAPEHDAHEELVDRVRCVMQSLEKRSRLVLELWMDDTNMKMIHKRLKDEYGMTAEISTVYRWWRKAREEFGQEWLRDMAC